MTSVAPVAGGQAELTARYTGALMNTFGPPKRVFVRGEGVHLWDAGEDHDIVLKGLQRGGGRQSAATATVRPPR